MASAFSPGDTLSAMQGVVKEVYAKDIQEAVPRVGKLQKEFPFSERTAVGDLYHQPVILQNEVGFTYQASDQTQLATYNPVLPMQMKDAQVRPAQIMLRSRIGYEVMNRARAAGPKAFKAATLLLIKNMVDSMALRIEMGMLYGGSGLGTVGAISLGSSSGGITPVTVTITLGQWAIGLWQGQESSNVDFWAPASASPTAPINTQTGNLANAPQLQQVFPTSRQLLINMTDANAASLQTAVNTTYGSGGASANNVSIYWNGAYNNEMIGLKTILTNTGTLFNINAALFDLWQGNVVSAGGSPLTFATVQKAVAPCAARGLVDEELLLVISNDAWADLLTSQAALRQYDQSYSTSKFEQGAKALEFASQNGKIRVMTHNMVKDGDAFLLPVSEIERIGACEPTFQQPGYESAVPFVPLTDYPGMQLVRYSSQQIFLKAPARAAIITGIVNSDGV